VERHGPMGQCCLERLFRDERVRDRQRSQAARMAVALGETRCDSGSTRGRPSKLRAD
jgi:hypothetical protein